ncbi:MAG: EAL domain-containing protein [Alphaproteobacteria bacterium]|nr:EAL domain-containing protein [Alphaproteobacteria bacterium]
MPLIAHAMFYVAYAVLAAAVGVALAVIGGGDGASATLGGLATFAAFAVTHAALTAAHATGAVRATEKRLKGEIDKVRTLHKEIAEDVSIVAERLDTLDDRVAEVALRRAEPAGGGEVRALEALVDRLGRSLDMRFEEIKRVALPNAAAPSRQLSPIEMVREALLENRVELHMQPIVALPQRRTAFYEGFSRLRDSTGRLIAPSEFIPAAEQAGMMSTIDNMLLFRAVQIVRKLMAQDRRIGIVCNLSPRSLSDESFFPQFLDFMHENRDLGGAVVFEIAHEAFESRTAAQARAMARLADLGFFFSIDKAKSLAIDLPDLERAGVRYFKAPASMVIDQIVHAGVRPKSNIAREIAPRDVTAVFRRYGVDLVGEFVEDEATVSELLDLDLPYAQGHLFGAARAIKESLMEATAPPKGFFGRAAG